MMRKFPGTYPLVIAFLAVSACRTAVPPPAVTAAVACNGHHNLDSTLWVQTSAEYRALGFQAYTAARAGLDRGLADPKWTAALEQTGSYESLPPAVILDVDETVLDNSAYQVRLMRSGKSFDPQSWSRFVSDQKAGSVAGAVEFTRYAKDRGVEVFFVTNHTVQDEPNARRRLRTLGFPLDDSIDTFLAVGEQSAAATSDKTDRRKWVAARYRILVQIGDALGDFMPEPSISLAERRLTADKYAAWWGTRWIVIPDPMYGAWERAVLKNPAPLDPQQQIQRKMETLDAGE